ncbi:conserved hypothetical protein [Ricinus communis]|uniref:Uncharacterized protein n=1 Tax=Ricinus communis TaxID=3988 RepID=B9SAM0_RICCO|nr:conserved hypothetical protein [Ricinus communis]
MSAPCLKTTLQYHSELLHWLCYDVSNLCHNQGIPVAPHPMYPSYSTVAGTKEIHDNDTNNEVVDNTEATHNGNDNTPFDD